MIRRRNHFQQVANCCLCLQLLITSTGPGLYGRRCQLWTEVVVHIVVVTFMSLHQGIMQRCSTVLVLRMFTAQKMHNFLCCDHKILHLLQPRTCRGLRRMWYFIPISVQRNEFCIFWAVNVHGAYQLIAFALFSKAGIWGRWRCDEPRPWA